MQVLVLMHWEAGLVAAFATQEAADAYLIERGLDPNDLDADYELEWLEVTKC